MLELACAVAVLTVAYGFVLWSLGSSMEDLQDRVRELEQSER